MRACVRACKCALCSVCCLHQRLHLQSSLFFFCFPLFNLVYFIYIYILLLISCSVLVLLHLSNRHIPFLHQLSCSVRLIIIDQPPDCLSLIHILFSQPPPILSTYLNFSSLLFVPETRMILFVSKTYQSFNSTNRSLTHSPKEPHAFSPSDIHFFVLL